MLLRKYAEKTKFLIIIECKSVEKISRKHHVDEYENIDQQNR